MNKLNLIKHRKGSYNDYDPNLYHNVIYFAEDQQVIILNGVEYSGEDYIFEPEPEIFIFKIETTPTDRFQLTQNNIRNPILYEFDFGDEIIEYNSSDYNNKIIEHIYKDGEIKPRTIKFNIKSDTNINSYDDIFKIFELAGITKYTVGGINGILYPYIDASTYNTNNFNITILDNVKEIAPYAFCRYKMVNKINIPNSVISIEGGAFYDCISLIEITIPNSVTLIRGSAFSGCILLKEIIIPDSVTWIERGAFNECISLNKVYVCEDTVLNNEWLGDSKPEVIKYKKGEKPWLNNK